jgi:hypothetical protein
MNSVARTPLSTGAKIFVWVAIVIGTLRMLDFVFYGQAIRDLLAAIGFALMAYGVLKNGLRPAIGDRAAAVDIAGRYATNIGALLIVAAFVLQWLQ